VSFEEGYDFQAPSIFQIILCHVAMKVKMEGNVLLHLNGPRIHGDKLKKYGKINLLNYRFMVNSFQLNHTTLICTTRLSHIDLSTIHTILDFNHNNKLHAFLICGCHTN